MAIGRTNRASPVWILPVNKHPLEFNSLSGNQDGVVWIMEKPGLPEPAQKIRIDNERQVWLYDSERFVFKKTVSCSKQQWIDFSKIITPQWNTRHRLSFFGETAGYVTVMLTIQFSREVGRINISQPSDLLSELFEASDEEIEQKSWEALEAKFNEYLKFAQETYDQKKKSTKEHVRALLAEYLEEARELEKLECFTFSANTKSLTNQLGQIKQLKGMRSVGISGENIIIRTQPIVTTYENVSYFMGEFEIIIGMDHLPVMKNLSFDINGYQHPHISASNVCYGTFKEVMPGLLKDRELVQIVLFCQSFLQKYNKDSPYKRIDLFPVWKDGKILSPTTVTWHKKYPQWGIE